MNNFSALKPTSKFTFHYIMANKWKELDGINTTFVLFYA